MNKKAKEQAMKNLEKGKFKKGQSGNPKGKKKGTQSIKTILERYLAIDSGKIHPKTGEPMNYYEAMAAEQLKKAMEGELPSFKEIADRFEGQSIQNINLSDLTEDEIDSKLSELLGDKYKPRK